MKRGEIWTASGGSNYAGKPRPVVVVQDDRFAGLQSATICSFTTDPSGEDVVRLMIAPTPTNGLREPSRLMVDKITTVAKSKLGYRVGSLDSADVRRLDAALAVFLGLAG